MQPAHFTAELPDTLAVGQMEQKSLFYWPTFMLGNAFPVETGVDVTHAEICSEEMYRSLLPGSLLRPICHFSFIWKFHGKQITLKLEANYSKKLWSFCRSLG